MKLRILILFICLASIFEVTVQQEGEDDACKDELNYCDNISVYCTDEEYEDYMKKNCKKTCKLCLKDIDPNGLCTTANGGCKHRCTVQDQTKKVCECWEGYELESDGLSCRDTDECSKDVPPCSPTKFCYNFEGGFSCVERECPNENEVPYMGSTACCKDISRDAECGVSAQPTRRVVGGNDSHLAQWPWQVYINIDKGVLCGGTLLNKNWVVTAGHCFKGYTEETDMTLFFGVLKLNELEDNHVQERKLKRRIMYPGWTSDEFYNNDIALIELDKPVKYTKFVKPACLPNGEKPKIGYKCYVSGWGLTDEDKDKPSSRLQHVDLPIVDPDKCTESYKEEPTPFNRTHMICAGYDEGGKDACRGDSGGPLVCQRCSSCAWYIAGVVSFGNGCAQAGFYGVYANVHYFEDWLSEHTGIPVSNDKACTGPYLTEWSLWSQCDKSCGNGGQRNRERRCLDKGLDSDKCSGALKETGDCEFKECPRFGKFDSWSECSKKCGTGKKTRVRQCLNGKIGEDGCPNEGATQAEDCNTHTCVGKWKAWKQWSTCSAKCGTGSQGRTRECDGQGCVGKDREEQECNTHNCPEWSKWSAWQQCTKLCGGGDETRTRECSSPQKSDCEGSSEETRKCNIQECQGKWTDWSAWTNCDVTCGEGTVTRSRSCEGRKVGEPGCDVGSAEETNKCTLDPCSSKWGRWGNWSECSKTCDRGLSTRTRLCQGGKAGEGECVPASATKEERACNEISCTECVDAADISDPSYCGRYFATEAACSQYPDYAKQYCAKSCNMCLGLHENWQAWGECSESCGPGVRTRLRECNNDNGCEGDSEETGSCDFPCKGFTQWSRWSRCTKTCGGGSRDRTRSCPFEDCQPDETGSVELTQDGECNADPCPGEWDDWGKWSDCSKTCGNDGVETRERNCLGGEPGGPGCIGKATATRSCRNNPRCPAAWGDWNKWSQCSQECGGGTRRRTRRCQGRGCKGVRVENEDCNIDACVAKWGEWSDFGACDSDCFKWKTRACIGGNSGDSGCEGEERESEKCDPGICRSATDCGSISDDDIGCRFIDTNTICLIERFAKQCPFACCNAKASRVCADDPNYKQWCGFTQLCNNPSLKDMFHQFCRKSCGLC